MRIPLVNLSRLWELHADGMTRALTSVAARSEFILGPAVAAFEEEFAKFEGAEFAVGLASGTDAVHLGLRAAGVQAGDEVITVANTFAATIEAILYLGARPTFVDVDDHSLLIDGNAVESAITPRTKAIVPVHLSGRPADLPHLEKIADRYGLALVQDAAQAHGARLGDRGLGRFGRAATYSFFPGKNLGALGDAGALVTNDEAVFETVRKLRDHGRVGKYDHAILGFNSRLDSIQAAVLSYKLRFLDEWNEHRRRSAALYRSFLDDRIRVVSDPAEAVSSYHHFMVRVPEREKFQHALRENGIGFGVHYPIPCHQLKAFEFLGVPKGSLPVTERAATEVLSLPLDPTITPEEIAEVSDVILSVAAEIGI